MVEEPVDTCFNYKLDSNTGCMMRKTLSDSTGSGDAMAAGAAFEPSRRRFNQSLVVGLAVAALPGAGLSLRSDSALAPFEIRYPADVVVRIGAGEHFSVAVATTDGRELERHERVTGSSIHRLRSDYFTVTRIDAPGTV